MPFAPVSAILEGMKSLTLELDEKTLHGLKQVASQARKKEATVAREWIEDRLRAEQEPSCFDLMKPAWRSIKGPKDLSQREGFGE